MPKKLKVFISAYACEPNKGSEPEVGWQWVLQMARYHDVTVLTRANNRTGIEKELAALNGGPANLHFVYHDLGPGMLRLKKRFKATRFYYVQWQKTARDIVAQLHREKKFDLMHHVTFAAFRYPTVIWGHGVPTVWGPVGGAESIPWGLLPWTHLPSLIPEAFRNLNNIFHTSRFHKLPSRGRKTTLSLASTGEMQEKFRHLGLPATLMATIGLPAPKPLTVNSRKSSGPLRMLYVGNLIALKGIQFAIEALKLSGIDATLTLVGDGNFTPVLKALTARLDLEKQIDFRGRMPRLETLDLYPEYDVFVFPSLHDTGGYAVIEAMACGLPVICLDCGGPKVAVKDGAGCRITVGSRKQVIADMARAFSSYSIDRELLIKHGKAAWEVLACEYDWAIKGREMDEIYQKAVGEHEMKVKLLQKKLE